MPRCLKGGLEPRPTFYSRNGGTKVETLEVHLQGAKQISSDPNVGALAGIVSVSLKEDQQQETADLPDHNWNCGGLML